MENHIHEIGSYEIWKDIILPSASLLATIIIGVFIAVILKNKEQKAKKKELLIDSYMEYLDVWTKNYKEDSERITYEILKEIRESYPLHFPDHQDIKLFNELIDLRIMKFRKQIDEEHSTEHWSPFTYKFAFLLSKSEYDKHLQKLEDKIVQNYVSGALITNIKHNVLEELSSDPIIKSDIVLKNRSKIENALDQIENKAALRFNDFLSALFNPYNTKLANLINDL